MCIIVAFLQPTERPNKSALLGKRAGSIGEELLMYSDIVVGEYELIRLCTLLKVSSLPGFAVLLGHATGWSGCARSKASDEGV